MIIHNLARIPEGLGYSFSDTTDELTKSEVKDLEELGIDEVWYWYVSGSYEGSGQMIIRKEDKYYLHNMSHCSCYGPLDEIDMSDARAFSSLNEMKRRCSKHYLVEVLPLIEEASK